MRRYRPKPENLKELRRADEDLKALEYLEQSPGFKLVRDARDAGHAVTALPGASGVSITCEGAASAVISRRLVERNALGNRVILSAAHTRDALGIAPELCVEYGLCLLDWRLNKDVRPLEFLLSARVHIPEMSPH